MNKISATLVNMLLGLGIILVIVCLLSTIFKIREQRKNSNRAFGIDVDNRFNQASLRLDGQWRRISVKTWRDFEDSDVVQVTDTNDVVYLTHYSNMILISK